jgi:hypothetical protein
VKKRPPHSQGLETPFNKARSAEATRSATGQ